MRHFWMKVVEWMILDVGEWWSRGKGEDEGEVGGDAKERWWWWW